MPGRHEESGRTFGRRTLGGTEVWIKPGDSIKFASSLVGVSVGGALADQTIPVLGSLGGTLNKALQPSQVAGLNVSP